MIKELVREIFSLQQTEGHSLYSIKGNPVKWCRSLNFNLMPAFFLSFCLTFKLSFFVLPSLLSILSSSTPFKWLAFTLNVPDWSDFVELRVQRCVSSPVFDHVLLCFLSVTIHSSLPQSLYLMFNATQPQGNSYFGVAVNRAGSTTLGSRLRASLSFRGHEPKGL